ncbi:hypothetical protein BV25DRAFT_329160 [Artomyces pyxidatus]|uniref:Uncharacterized protein n=1 Tax=Artomyces pyxidatus TaxID=48021 RepID=A0ACB8T6F2_9AGAM|nr:hypothetical protein BV25DRAFT_329160 [Artomyces pyxidatus]
MSLETTPTPLRFTPWPSILWASRRQYLRWKCSKHIEKADTIHPVTNATRKHQTSSCDWSGRDLERPRYLLYRSCAVFYPSRTCGPSPPRIYLARQWQGDDWYAVFGPLKSVMHLRVSDLAVNGLCDVLARLTPGRNPYTNDVEDHIEMLSLLQSLYLRRSELHGPINLGEFPTQQMCPIPLKNLRTRKSLGAGLKTLEVLTESFQEECMEAYFEAVECCLWDNDHTAYSAHGGAKDPEDEDADMLDESSNW